MKRMRTFQARSFEEVRKLLKRNGLNYISIRAISGYEVIAGFPGSGEDSKLQASANLVLYGITAIVLKNRGGWPESHK